MPLLGVRNRPSWAGNLPGPVFRMLERRPLVLNIFSCGPCSQKTGDIVAALREDKSRVSIQVHWSRFLVVVGASEEGSSVSRYAVCTGSVVVPESGSGAQLDVFNG